MELLLDTHVFVWWLGNDPRLSPRAREAIMRATRVLVSAASIWEMAIKMKLGKLAIAGSVELRGLIAAASFDELPISARHGAGVLDLPLHHSDPFDRLLIAQARSEQLAMATVDPAFS